MPRWIERRNTPEGPRYREWSSIIDQYCTPELTREEMLDHLVWDDRREDLRREQVERLDRTDRQGNSLLDGSRVTNMDSPWCTERCDECGQFHHEFSLRESDGLCSNCGEPRSDKGHETPCSED